jgi:glycosyltransferase involved in cell wall biosynthesis
VASGGELTSLRIRKTAGNPYHHGSHRKLLAKTAAVPKDSGMVEAIMVPTARPSASMGPAIHLASELGCVLVALCSKESSASEVASIAEREGIGLIAIDTDDLPAGLIPEFNTTELLAETPYERTTDTSLKRNLGLLIARILGWQRIVFLDDDIEIPNPGDLNDAVRLLGRYDAAGLHIEGFPDNSVVCHANRATGGAQECFIGGGALAVGSASLTSFFPKIYNEDWFFLLDDVQLRPTGITGSAKQQPYDPFADAQRAVSEELGDCLAEGLFWLLDGGKRVKDANIAYWHEFLGNRLSFISQVKHKIPRLNKTSGEKARMIAALDAAHERCLTITPLLCVRYLRAWRADCTRWRNHVIDLCGRLGSVTHEKVISELGLAECGLYVGATSQAA